MRILSEEARNNRILKLRDYKKTRLKAGFPQEAKPYLIFASL